MSNDSSSTRTNRSNETQPRKATPEQPASTSRARASVRAAAALRASLSGSDPIARNVALKILAAGPAYETREMRASRLGVSRGQLYQIELAAQGHAPPRAAYARIRAAYEGPFLDLRNCVLAEVERCLAEHPHNRRAQAAMLQTHQDGVRKLAALLPDPRWMYHGMEHDTGMYPGCTCAQCTHAKDLLDRLGPAKARSEYLALRRRERRKELAALGEGQCTKPAPMHSCSENP